MYILLYTYVDFTLKRISLIYLIQLEELLVYLKSIFELLKLFDDHHLWLYYESCNYKLLSFY